MEKLCELRLNQKTDKINSRLTCFDKGLTRQNVYLIWKMCELTDSTKSHVEKLVELQEKLTMFEWHLVEQWNVGYEQIFEQIQKISVTIGNRGHLESGVLMFCFEMSMKIDKNKEASFSKTA